MVTVTSNDQVQALLKNRGKTGTVVKDYALERDKTGVTFISTWNVATLGPLPTQAELDAITPTQIDTTKEEQAKEQARTSAGTKDHLALLMLIAREVDPAKWDATSPEQQIAAAQLLVEIEATNRALLEKYLP